MRTIRGAVGAVALCLALNGCASVVGTLTAPAPYIGTKLDAQAIVNMRDLTPFFCAIDLPFSVVLDTLLLPVTMLIEASQ